MFSVGGYVINPDNIEFVNIGRDSATVFTISGSRFSIPSGAEEFIDFLGKLSNFVQVDKRIFNTGQIIHIKYNASMATITMGSAYTTSVLGEVAVKNLMDQINIACPDCSDDPQTPAVPTEQTYKVMKPAPTPKGGTRKS